MIEGFEEFVPVQRRSLLGKAHLELVVALHTGDQERIVEAAASMRRAGFPDLAKAIEVTPVGELDQLVDQVYRLHFQAVRETSQPPDVAPSF